MDSVGVYVFVLQTLRPLNASLPRPSKGGVRPSTPLNGVGGRVLDRVGTPRLSGGSASGSSDIPPFDRN